ncbi:MAG TPA: YceI family protein [Chitinophagaceae bacterium]|nr:YceI family protein [Chitinophagaceae bacterium]
MIKKIIIAAIVFSLFASIVNAQGKFYTKSGKISIFSATSMENISAVNKSSVCLLDSKTGDLQFAVLMKGFEFRKAKMQEDFNSDYVESSKFPKSEFKGQITNNSTVNYNSNVTYSVNVKGKLTIHGVTRDVESTGTITIKDGKLLANSVFNILIADYNIKVPKMYMDNISKSIKITVDCTLEPLK